MLFERNLNLRKILGDMGVCTMSVKILPRIVLEKCEKWVSMGMGVFLFLERWFPTVKCF